MSPFQFRNELSHALKNTLAHIRLSDIFKRNKNILFDDKSTRMFIDSWENFFSVSSKYFNDNIMELLNRQCDIESVEKTYLLLRTKVSHQDIRPALEHSAKHSTSVLVWKFLTSVLEWNLGINSLRFLIKETNPAYLSSHQKYLFHKEGGSFLLEEDLFKHHGSTPV